MQTHPPISPPHTHTHTVTHTLPPPPLPAGRVAPRQLCGHEQAGGCVWLLGVDAGVQGPLRRPGAGRGRRGLGLPLQPLAQGAGGAGQHDCGLE